MGDEIRVNKSVPIIPQKKTLKHAKREDQQEHKHKNEAGDHFQQLSNAAKLANDVLERDKSPYRFRIYQEGEEVFIDIVIVDDDLTIKETKKTNITHEEFTTWLNHIEQGNGLFFDITA
ncbi:MAG: hypothetical protein K8F52_17735 [Candidatus Scalindua rubra]|uniref:Uncharacterized protein n=1 Tax=Candidatus Scalindua brodae TaxID=237368 RepID=A0A0B0EQE9_9BACT|nr:MAG: hypothetical protein SCABRO_01269 [Candidatus Scalindua brodae]MBZ0110497.1 hypothetical protein [Candidatus Scalindua rubra]TWU36333.1 hypothetical protein S225a_06120 [Candidatus Brocadiaceae bacterium S225]